MFIFYEQTEGREFDKKTGRYSGEFTGKGLLDIEIIRKMMFMEEKLQNDPEYKKFCLARTPLEGETEPVCDLVNGRTSGALTLTSVRPELDW